MMSSDNETTINELRPNRRLLDPNFDCYRLASDQLEVRQHKFEVKPAILYESNQLGLHSTVYITLKSLIVLRQVYLLLCYARHD